MRQHTLPPQFSEIANKVSNVLCVGENEYHGSCPACGGKDRFVMWVVSKGGFPLGWCRKCPYRWYPQREKQPSREELEQWRVEQIKIETERKEKAERALQLLNSERIWERFYEQNNDYSMQLYRERGFADSWIKYLQFGLIPDYTVRTRGGGEFEEYHSPVLTIPLWEVGRVNQVKLRTINPKYVNDRYRNYYEKVGTKLYVPLHDMPIKDCAVVICEGEFKAGLMEQTLDNLKLRCVGIPSKTPSPDIFEIIKDVEPVYIWLDPDAFEKEVKQSQSAVGRMVDVLGRERARIVKCPIKSDDGILQGMSPMNYIRMARKA